MRLKRIGIKTSLTVAALSLVGFGLQSSVTTAHAATNSFGTGALAYGSTGQNVRVLQLALQNFGTFPNTSSVTTFFGTTTQSAVKKFQSAMGLQADGVSGSATKQGLLKLGYQEYLVESGDTVWSIGSRYNESTAQMTQENHLSSSNLYVGQALLVHTKNQSSASSNTQSSQSPLVTTQVQQVVNLVNQERAKAGLKPLSLNLQLTKMAHDKALDMKNNNYFDHQSPTYGSPFDMMKTYGISYSYAGENIAAGQQSAQDVMNAWMNSSGHRANILSPKYTQIGVGYVPGGQYGTEWVQEFIQP